MHYYPSQSPHPLVLSQGAVLNVLCQESTSHRSGRGYYDRERGWAYDSDNPVNRRR